MPRPRRFKAKPIAFVIPIFVIAWLVIPQVADYATMSLLTVSSIYTIVALGVAILLGQAGIVSLAQAAFFGIGAFTAAYTTGTLGWPFYSGVLVGILLCVAVAVVLGIAVLRLEGYYLALATLALGSIAVVLFGQWDSLTGGTLGVGGVPGLEIGTIDLFDQDYFYYVGWVIAGLVMVLVNALLKSPTGMAMRAMRDKPEAAAVMAIRISRMRLFLFVLSAALGAFGGALYAHYSGYVNMSSFGVDRALMFVLMGVLGGTSRVWGAAVGAVLVTVLPAWLIDFGDLHQVLFGIVMVAVIVFLPGGLTQMSDRLRLRRSQS